ncbi:MAG: DMT family transporter [Calditrichia bacterium]
MKARTLKSDLLLLLAALIWGFAFVAQRVGMDYVGPFLFNGVRFALGTSFLIPFYFLSNRSRRETSTREIDSRIKWLGGIYAGVIVFGGASFQQIGLVYTTAGKAGFITGLYVIIVPILGLFWKQKTLFNTWLGAVFATVGLYLLSVTQNFTVEFGDFLVLIGAFFWAAHVQIIGWLTTHIRPIRIAIIQFAVCSILSLIVALFIETIRIDRLLQALVPILYAGFLSVGIAYTLQVIAQKHAPPAHAAILLSLEAIFAVLGGWMVLGEMLTLREMVGSLLMLIGMILSQLRFGAAGVHSKALREEVP